jgi:hypothetical protein
MCIAFCLFYIFVCMVYIHMNLFLFYFVSSYVWYIHPYESLSVLFCVFVCMVYTSIWISFCFILCLRMYGIHPCEYLLFFHACIPAAGQGLTLTAADSVVMSVYVWYTSMWISHFLSCRHPSCGTRADSHRGRHSSFRRASRDTRHTCASRGQSAPRRPGVVCQHTLLWVWCISCINILIILSLVLCISSTYCLYININMDPCELWLVWIWSISCIHTADCKITGNPATVFNDFLVVKWYKNPVRWFLCIKIKRTERTA